MKIKQKDIAELLGISQPLLSMIRNGERNVTYGLAKKLHALTRIEVTFWMDATPEEFRDALSTLERTVNVRD
jgi:transcriptional regulator with XRE-family HTH domain